jgi:hypothetical protein
VARTLITLTCPECGAAYSVNGECMANRRKYCSYRCARKAVSRRRDYAAAFWQRMRKNGSCLEWTGATEFGGYGHAAYKGKIQKTSRIAYQLIHGPIPVGMCVLHRCDNPLCCNPEHLFLGTIADNNRDKEMKNRGNHAKGTRHARAKLTEGLVLELRQRYSGGESSYKKLAEEYDVHPATIREAVLGLTWRHI